MVKKISKWEKGRSYLYQDIVSYFEEDGIISEYGESYVGKEAIHVMDDKDYWFILNMATVKGYYYKLVYKA